MVNIGIRLKPAEHRHVDRMRLTDKRQIVAQKIDDHDVFGAVLFGGEKLLGAARILNRDRVSAGSCP